MGTVGGVARVLWEVENTTDISVILGRGVQHGLRRAMAVTQRVAELSSGGAELGLPNRGKEFALAGFISVKGARVQGLKAECLPREMQLRELGAGVVERAAEDGIPSGVGRGGETGVRRGGWRGEGLPQLDLAAADSAEQGIVRTVEVRLSLATVAHLPGFDVGKEGRETRGSWAAGRNGLVNKSAEVGPRLWVVKVAGGETPAAVGRFDLRVADTKAEAGVVGEGGVTPLHGHKEVRMVGGEMFK